MGALSRDSLVDIVNAPRLLVLAGEKKNKYVKRQTQTPEQSLVGGGGVTENTISRWQRRRALISRPPYPFLLAPLLQPATVQARECAVPRLGSSGGRHGSCAGSGGGCHLHIYICSCLSTASGAWAVACGFPSWAANESQGTWFGKASRGGGASCGANWATTYVSRVVVTSGFGVGLDWPDGDQCFGARSCPSSVFVPPRSGAPTSISSPSLLFRFSRLCNARRPTTRGGRGCLNSFPLVFGLLSFFGGCCPRLHPIPSSAPTAMQSGAVMRCSWRWSR